MNDVTARRVLVVEDSDGKWRNIERLLVSIGEQRVEIVRAATIEAANRQVSSGIWDLVLLDISMDIRSSTQGAGAGGHLAVGGLKIAERMFYLGHDAPVIIVTAFDAFPSGNGRQGAVLGLGDVIAEASALIGDLLVGWVRYGDPNWEEDLAERVRRILFK